MKILAIRGKNLASLAGEFDVNFAQEPLQSAGLFAISGSTGAGKSTLLDALCMALYERTPRLFKAGNQALPDVGWHSVSQQDARNLLRRGCAEGYAEVDFVGSDQHSYRARWSVRRARSKVDGSLQKTVMSLHQLPGLQALGGTNKEVLAEIHQRLGLSFEQFTRAVLLAQNEFSAFLKADDNERGELLETLTGRTLYSTLSQRAFARHKLEQLALQRINDRLADQKPLSDEALAQLTQDHQVAQQLVDNLAAQHVQLTAALRWFETDAQLHQREQQAQQAVQAAQETLAAATPRLTALHAVEAVQTARPLVDTRDRLRVAYAQVQQQQAESQQRTAQAHLKHQNALMRLQDGHQQLQKEEQSQASAAPQLEHAKQLDTRIAALAPGHQAATDALAQARHAAQQLASQCQAKRVEADTAQTRQANIENWLHQHAALQPLAEQWPRWDLLLQQAHTLLDDTQHHTTTLTRLVALQTQQQRVLDAAKAAQADADQTALSAAQQREATQAEHAQTDIATVQRQKTQAHTRRDGLNRAQQLHHAQHEGQQRSLTLQADEAAEHAAATQSAQAAYDRATHTQTRAKEANVAALTRQDQLVVEYRTASAQQQQSQAQLAARLDELEAAFKVTDWRDAWQADPQAFHAQCAHNARQWTAQHHAHATGQQTIATLALERRSLDAQSQQALAHQSDAQTAFTASAAAQAQLQTERQTLFQGQPVAAIVALWASTLHALKAQCDQHNVIHSEAQQALTRATEAQAQAHAQGEALQQDGQRAVQALDDWLVAYNHSDSAAPTHPLTVDALCVLLAHSPLWISQERAHITALDNAVSLATSVRQERSSQRQAHQAHPASPTHEAHRPEDVADPQALQAALAVLSTARTNAQTQATQHQLQLAQDHERRQRNGELLQELAAQEATHRVWAQLNSLIGAADGKKFRNYAQQTTLDVLLGYTNRHLHELSRRYRLQRIQETLALLVIDQDMGDEQRSVHSLSGGESFLVSLALALGLASLSSNRVKVESLFIDEGFGSLDADTLRVAMDALDGLQAMGRKVGVISHVQEMTERIAVKITVQRTAGGRSVVGVQQGM